MELKITKIALLGVLALGLTACTTRNDLGKDAAQAVGGFGAGAFADQNIQAGSIQEFQQIVGDSILFDTNASTLNEAGRQLLGKQFTWIVNNRVKGIRIEGHADERGTRQYNIALGAKRASAVKDYMVSLGYPGAAIETLSYGKERPVSLCDNISCWSQNRRATTSITAR